ncbi:MAG TPA: G1 family glutamic endopeptidase, partial [Phycisphaerae bacterium]|nr:G1 family glutamic endopeptidase [Phycisphaerae bacterium]
MRYEGGNVQAPKVTLWPMPVFFTGLYPPISHRRKLLAGACVAAGLSAVFFAPRTGFSADLPAATTVTSTNWAGYADLASTGQTFSDVSGEWVVPTIIPSTGAYTAIWVGLDGFNSSTVEQTGIGSYVSGGVTQYYAWYEMYPQNEVPISMTIQPGNLMYADASYTGFITFGKTKEYQYKLTIDDLTTGDNYSTNQTTTSHDARSSAEWIAESPSSYSGILPLANFGSVTFTNASTKLNGTTGTISSFTNDAIILQNSSGLDGVPSSLNSTGTSFTVTVTPQPSPIYWAGSGSGDTGDAKTWDIGFNQNWINGSIRTTYLDGDPVVFNDSGAPNYSVTLNATVRPGSVTVNSSLGNYVISGSGGIAGSTGLTKGGSASLTLSTADTYSGLTQIGNGTLIVGNSTAIPVGGSVKFGDGTNSGTLDLGGIGATVGGLAITSGSHGTVTNNGAEPATLTFAGSSSTFNGTIQNGSSILSLAVNSGTLTLGGALSYTGGTTINSGTLILGSGATIASPLISVQSGGIFNVSAVSSFTVGASTAQTIDGTGSVIGSVTIGANGTLSPGTGILSVGALTVNGNVNLNGAFAAQVTPTSGNNDQLSASGSVTLGGAENIGATGALSNGETFTVISSGQVYGSFNSVNLPALNTGLSWNQPLNLNNSVSGAANSYQQNYVYSMTNSTPGYKSSLPANDTYAGFNAGDNIAGGRGTSVTFLGGAVSSATSLSVQYAAASGSNPNLISDVISINGTNSDMYVLELNYNIISVT